MKLAGIFNPYGFNVLKEEITTPINLYLIYQNNEGKYFIEFLDQGDLALLLSKLETIKNKYLRKKEIEKYLTKDKSMIGCRYRYKSIKNKYYFEPFSLTKDELESFTSLQEFPKESLHLENESYENTQNYKIATIFPKKGLYIGSREFIYQNNLDYLKIEEKTNTEIKKILIWLIENFYLEEAKEIINRIKLSKISLDEYTHPDNLVIFDGSKNFLEQQTNTIKAIEFVQEQTKHLKLKIFEN